MAIFGKPLSEYFAFGRVFFILVPLVGILRLGLSLQGVPQSSVRWISMTAVASLGVIYFAIRVHTTGFGSYKQLLVLIAIQTTLAQVVAGIAILLTIFTGIENIYSAPEYSLSNQWAHFAVHVLLGPIIGSLSTWAVACLILAITRKVSRQEPSV